MELILDTQEISEIANRIYWTAMLEQALMFLAILAISYPTLKKHSQTKRK